MNPIPGSRRNYSSQGPFLNQARSATAPINHVDPATSLKILKKDFHLFREQAAKDKAKAETYCTRVAELEKEQYMLRDTLDHRNAYNDSKDHTARLNHNPDPAIASIFLTQGQMAWVRPPRSILPNHLHKSSSYELSLSFTSTSTNSRITRTNPHSGSRPTRTIWATQPNLNTQPA